MSLNINHTPYKYTDAKIANQLLSAGITVSPKNVQLAAKIFRDENACTGQIPTFAKEFML